MKKKIKITPDMAVVLEGRIKAFREKFGHEPGPGDPYSLIRMRINRGPAPKLNRMPAGNRFATRCSPLVATRPLSTPPAKRSALLHRRTGRI